MSLSNHIKKVLEGTGKKSLLGMIFSLEGLKMLADGNIGYMKMIKGYTQGTLVGEDLHGNKYFENNDLPYGRKRWVVYKDTFNYNSTSVPAEWHGWLNGINDYTPVNYKFKKPIYAVEAYQTRTGTEEAYGPKGNWKNPEKRNWKKFAAWVPPNAPEIHEHTTAPQQDMPKHSTAPTRTPNA